jgi:prepilin-type N-terminal cleavage/methylation domain-containing protein
MHSLPLKCIAGGFTMLEILAVIAILAVLMAVLVPASLAIWEKSHSAQCISNLRQMGAAFGSYAADNDGCLPTNNDKYPGRWYLVLNPYLGLKDSDRSRPSIFICPANDRKTDMGNFALWSDVSYWCNLFFMPRATKGSDGKITSWANSPGPVRIVSLPRHRILVADNPKGMGANAYMKNLRNAAYARANRPYPDGDESDLHSMARIHGKGINALFTDFSVRFLEAEDVNRPGSEIETGAYFGN